MKLRTAIPSALPRVRAVLAGKLSQDILWNFASLAILGVSGVLLNVLIGVFYNAETLGIFNQVFAAYLLFSQFATGGFHYSTLKYVAQHADDPKLCRQIIVSALLATSALALGATLVFWWAALPLSQLLDSPGVRQGMQWAAPGLFFYALNKVLLGVLNGRRWMRSFAALSALRPILLISALFVAALLEAPGAILAGAFSVAESVLFVVTFAGLLPHLRIRIQELRTSLGHWLRVHSSFGFRSCLSGALIELNTRVDVLMLGYFASDGLVGIYSFAAIWAEGLTQLLFVLRNNFNPLLVQKIARDQWTELQDFIRKGKKATYGLMSLVGICAVVAYPLIVGWFADKPEFHSSWPIFAILVAGIVVTAGYFPFGTILLQAGRPGLHTGLMFVCVAFNAVANYFCIPLWGAPGAAAATAVSFIFSVIALRALARIKVGISL